MTVALKAADLPDACLYKVFGLLSASDLRQAAAVSRRWRNIADGDESLWKALALGRFPVETVFTASYARPPNSDPQFLYLSLKNLVLDDNRRQAHAILETESPGIAEWIGYDILGFRRRGNEYYACRVLGADLAFVDRNGRDANLFVIYVEARGELDLRHPRNSCLLLVSNNTREVVSCIKPVQCVSPKTKRGYHVAALVYVVDPKFWQPKHAGFKDKSSLGFSYEFVYSMTTQNPVGRPLSQMTNDYPATTVIRQADRIWEMMQSGQCRYRTPFGLLKQLQQETQAESCSRWKHVHRSKLEGSWYSSPEFELEALPKLYESETERSRRFWFF